MNKAIEQVADIRSETASARHGAPENIRLVTALACVGAFLVQLDGSALNVAVVQIGENLKVSSDILPWVVDAYGVVFACVLLAAGVLTDRYGARVIFIVGLGIFTAASLACAVSPDIGTLIASRAIQGVGGGLTIPSSMSLISRACGSDQALRSRLISVWAAAGGIAVTVGPIISGTFVTYVNWRGIFLINIPLGVIGILIAFGAMGRQRHDDKAGIEINWLSLMLVSVMLLALLQSVIERIGTDHAFSLGTPTWITMFLVCLAIFIAAENRSSSPVFPRQIVLSVPILGGLVAGFTLSFVAFGLVFGLGVYFQKTLALSAQQTGLAFVPFAITITLANMAGGRLAARFGPVPVVAVGLAVAAAGYGALAPIGAETSYLAMLPAQIVSRIGVGMAIPALTSFVLSKAQPELSGRTSGILSAVRQIGMAFGVAVYGAFTLADPVDGLRAAVLASAFLLTVVAVMFGAVQYLAPRSKSVQ